MYRIRAACDPRRLYNNENRIFREETEPEVYCQLHGGNIQSEQEEETGQPDGETEGGDVEPDGTKPGQTESVVLSGNLSGH